MFTGFYSTVVNERVQPIASLMAGTRWRYLCFAAYTTQRLKKLDCLFEGKRSMEQLNQSQSCNTDTLFDIGDLCI